MNIFVYGDGSGVFDRQHYRYFVFGGVIALSKRQRNRAYRKFVETERTIAAERHLDLDHPGELKGCLLDSRHRKKLFRCTNELFRYAFIIDLQALVEQIFAHKKLKRRYLDFVYKMGLRDCFAKLVECSAIQPDEVDNIYIKLDDHTMATDEQQILKEAIEDELKLGTFSLDRPSFSSPILPGMEGGIELRLCDSTRDALIRASDIVANYAYRKANAGHVQDLRTHMNVVAFP